MTEVKPTWLYIKRHSITGLKYFGCTSRYRAENYDGSGKYWSNHIKKHGRKFVVTDLIIGPYTNKEELEVLALWMSEKLDIVASSEWANLIHEGGLGTGNVKGFKMDDEQKHKVSILTKQAIQNFSPEKKQEMIENQKRQYWELSDDEREKRNAFLQDNTFASGKRSEKARENIKRGSQINKGNKYASGKRTPEQCNNIRMGKINAQLRRNQSQE